MTFINGIFMCYLYTHLLTRLIVLYSNSHRYGGLYRQQLLDYQKFRKESSRKLAHSFDLY